MPSVLIVEDDDEIREILAEMLTEGGFDVVTATNGQEALERLRSSEPPGLVVLDLMMPVMDGWQMRREMLADPDLRGIPVVIVSGAADIERTSASLEASKVLTKPVKWPVLLDSIRAHVRAV